jgi:hypothetical protein
VIEARDPFVFMGCVELREDLDRWALDERELMVRLEEAPADSVFYHMHGYFLRQRWLMPTYANDFATWAAHEVGDHGGLAQLQGVRRRGPRSVPNRLTMGTDHGNTRTEHGLCGLGEAFAEIHGKGGDLRGLTLCRLQNSPAQTRRGGQCSSA